MDKQTMVSSMVDLVQAHQQRVPELQTQLINLKRQDDVVANNWLLLRKHN